MTGGAPQAAALAALNSIVSVLLRKTQGSIVPGVRGLMVGPELTHRSSAASTDTLSIT